MTKNLFLYLFLVVLQAVHASPIKKGVTLAELEESSYALEPNAKAAILAESKNVRYEYSKQDGFSIVTDFYQKVKIYHKDALHQGIHYIYLFKSGAMNEDVFGIKGKTYTLKNGKIEEYKLEKESIFKERFSNSQDRIKVSLPRVTEGSVIEISYRLRSPFYTYIRPIRIQKEIPIKKLSIDLSIPEFYQFNTQLRRGELNINLNRSSSSDRIIFNYTDRATNGRTSYSSYDVDYKMNEYSIQQTDIASYQDEPYVNNVRNYTPTLEFFLKSITYPNTAPKSYAYTWADVLKGNYNNSAFKSEASKSGYFKNDLAPLLAKKGTEKEKLITIFEFVKHRMRWNEEFSSKAYNGVTEAFKAKVGSSGQINTILYAMLKKAKIKVKPIFVSSRENTLSIFPNYNAFDYMIVKAQLKTGETLLLDATDKNAIPNIMPNRVVMGMAKELTPDKTNEIEVNLRPNTPSVDQRMLTYSIDKDGYVSGTSKCRLRDYAAYQHRSHISEDPEKRTEEIQQATALEDILEYQRSGFKNPYQDIREEYSFEEEVLCTSTGTEIYFHPLLFFRKTENPFTLENRLFPIDFGFNMSRQYMVTITIPEGYKVKSIPEELKIGLPEKKGVFFYTTKVLADTIILNVKEELQTGFFGAYEQPVLKQFYKSIVAKQNEQIVLERI